jgi:hypothetical protein
MRFHFAGPGRRTLWLTVEPHAAVTEFRECLAWFRAEHRGLLGKPSMPSRNPRRLDDVPHLRCPSISEPNTDLFGLMNDISWSRQRQVKPCFLNSVILHGRHCLLKPRITVLTSGVPYLLHCFGQVRQIANIRRLECVTPTINTTQRPSSALGENGRTRANHRAKHSSYWGTRAHRRRLLLHVRSAARADKHCAA